MWSQRQEVPPTCRALLLPLQLLLLLPLPLLLRPLLVLHLQLCALQEMWQH